jgi:hypothetical protein
MDIVPGPPIAAAILGALAQPVALVALALGPAALRPPGRRFLASVAVAALVFVLAWWALPGTRSAAGTLASVCLLLTAIPLTFVFWSLMVWGFTLAMLTRLVQASWPLDRPAWVEEITGGGTVRDFMLNRLRILTATRLVRRREDAVRLSRRGRIAGWTVDLTRRLMGIV